MIETQVQRKSILVLPAILNTYFPSAPYFIRGGKKAGKCVEMLMFQDPKYLFSLKGYLDGKLEENSEPNTFHNHLAWLLAKSELRTPKMKCHYCGEEIAKNALFVKDHTNGKWSSRKELVSCSQVGCVTALADVGVLNYIFRKREIIPLKFSEVVKLPLDMGEISGFLQKAFGLEELTPQTAFEFFNR